MKYNRFCWRHIVFLCLSIFYISNSFAQTVLERGDVAVVGVNARNGGCSSDSSEDLVSIVFFKDITTGTQIALTDNGYNASTDTWRNTEGYRKLQYNGLNTIPRGTILQIRLRFGSIEFITFPYNNWTSLDSAGNIVLNNGGDQLYFLSPEADWNPLNLTSTYIDFDGEVLYGFSTTEWVSNPSGSQQSSLHPDVLPCNHMHPNSATDFLQYDGDRSPATQLIWINRIKDPDNWHPYTNCTDYNSEHNSSPLPIIDLDVFLSASSIEVCEGEQVTLTFSVSDPSSAYDIEYTDGLNSFTLENVSQSSQGTANHTISTDTTFSIVSAYLHDDVEQCPVYFDLTLLDVTVNVIPELSLNLPSDYPLNYCQGDPIDFPVILDEDDQEISGLWNPASIDTSTTGTHIYTFTPFEAECDESIEVSIEVESFEIDEDVFIHGHYYMCEDMPYTMSYLLELINLLADYDISLIHIETGNRLDLWLEDPFPFLDTFAIIDNFEILPGHYQVIFYPLDHGDNLPNNHEGYHINESCGDEWPGGTYFSIYSPEAGELSGQTQMCVGETQTLTVADVEPQFDAENNPIVFRTNWSSSDENIATVDENGNVNAIAQGEVSITYTVLNPFIQGQPIELNCEDSTEFTIYVNPIQSLIFEDMDICMDAEVNFPDTGEVVGSWSPTVIDTSEAGTTTYTFTPAEGECAEEGIFVVNVYDLSVSADIVHTACETSEGSISLNVSGYSDESNLTFSWSNGTNTWDTRDLVDLPAGSYSVTISDAVSECEITQSFEVENNEVTLVYSQTLQDEFCIGEDAYVLPSGISTSHGNVGGTWHLESLTGPVVTEIDTSVAGEFIYYFVPTAECYLNHYEHDVTIHALKTPTFDIIADYCEGATPEALPTTSNNGISGAWLPAVIDTSEAGTTPYTFTPAEGECAEEISISITIDEKITPTFVIQDLYCEGAIPDDLPTTSDNNISGTWSPAVIDTSIIGTRPYTFTPDEGQCADIETINVTVNPTIVLNPRLSPRYCVNANYLLPTEIDGISGSWYHHTTGRFDPITHIDFDVASSETTIIFIPDDGQEGCLLSEYSYTIEIIDAGGIYLDGPGASGGDISGISENIAVWGVAGYRVRNDSNNSGQYTVISGGEILSVHSSNGQITWISQGLTGTVVVKFRANGTGCEEYIEIIVVSDLPGGVIFPSIWLKADEVHQNQHSLLLQGRRVIEWKNAFTEHVVEQQAVNLRPDYEQNNEFPFNYHRYVNFNFSPQRNVYLSGNFSPYINSLDKFSIFNVSTANSPENSTLISFRPTPRQHVSIRPSSRVSVQLPGFTSESTYIGHTYTSFLNPTHGHYNQNVARITGTKNNRQSFKGFQNEYLNPNNSILATIQPPTQYHSRLTIGANDPGVVSGSGSFREYSNDKISEFIFYSRALTDEEYQRVRTYLAIKYGISFKLTPGSPEDDYVNSLGALIYNPEDHVGYHHNISIVGRDNSGFNGSAEAANKDLFQKQSKSVNNNGLLTLFVDNSIEQNPKFNSENPISTTFPNRNFFVIADNDAGLDLICHEDSFTRLNRVWKMTQIGNHPVVSLGFDPIDLPSNVNQILVSDDPTFPFESTEVADLSSFSGTGGNKKGYIFKNNNEDALNIPNGKYFTFAAVQTLDFEIELTYCINEVVNLNSTYQGISGTWSPSQLINTGVAGSFTYMFTPDDTCIQPISFDITINHEVIDFTSIEEISYCTYENHALPHTVGGVNGHWEDSSGDPILNLYSASEGELVLTFVPDDGPGCYAPQPVSFNMVDCACEEPATIISMTAEPSEFICPGENIQFTLVVSDAVTEIFWTSTGTGVFDITNLTEAIYTPSEADIANGNVSITATTNDPDGDIPRCSADSVTMNFNFTEKDKAEFDNMIISLCQGDEFTLPTPNNDVDGQWEDEDGDLITNINTNETGDSTLTFVPDASCHDTTDIEITIIEKPITSEIQFNTN